MTNDQAKVVSDLVYLITDGEDRAWLEWIYITDKKLDEQDEKRLMDLRIRFLNYGRE